MISCEDDEMLLEEHDVGEVRLSSMWSKGAKTNKRVVCVCENEIREKQRGTASIYCSIGLIINV